MEHQIFRANLDNAFAYLKNKKDLVYDDFSKIHEILFLDYYPWAGQDRKKTSPDIIISKGSVLFAEAHDIRLAVEHGLKLAQASDIFSKKPGEVMGLFAYGHPFLDGNGRTILPIFLELCYRAGFSLDWGRVEKDEYLKILTEEIESPGKGILDNYLLPFKGPRVKRQKWGRAF